MKHISTIVRWIARILGLFVVVMVVIFAIGEGFTDPSRLTTDEQILFVALLLMLVGALTAWKWEVGGGLLIFAGFGVFWYVEGSMPGRYFFLFPLAGCLHLIAWLLDHKPATPPTRAIATDKRAAKHDRKGKRRADA